MPAVHASDRHHLLIIDDEPYIGRIIQLKLEGLPFTVEVALDAATARDRLRSDDRIDLILLDIILPRASGLDLLEEIRAIPQRSETPVIMLTAKGEITDRERAASLGATDFLTKPFSPRNLLARINALFPYQG